MASRRPKKPRKPKSPTLDVPVTADVERYEEAIAAFEQRVPMTRAEWDELDVAERGHAFMVSEVAHADIVADTFEAIDTALTEGTTLEDFKADMAASLESEWGGERPGRVETIFRTNLMTAYSQGRDEIWSSPAVRAVRPYMRRDEIDDGRLCDECEKVAGLIRPADDPIWKSKLSGPLHHQCRGINTALTEEEAADEGGADPRNPDVQPDDGFGAAPVKPGKDWAPDTSKYPEPVREVLEQRLKKAPAASAAPPAQPTVASKMNAPERAVDFEDMRRIIASGEAEASPFVSEEVRAAAKKIDDAAYEAIQAIGGQAAGEADRLMAMDWEGSSSGSIAKSLKVLVREEGLASNAGEAGNTPDIYAEQGEAPREAVRLRYEATQEALKKLGIKEVKIYRGVGREQADLLNASVGDTVDLPVWEASSWSTSKTLANSFARSGGITVEMTVPAEQVYSIWYSEMNFINEREAVLLRRGPTMAKVVKSWRR